MPFLPPNQQHQSTEGIQYKQASNIYSAKITNGIKGALCCRALHRAPLWLLLLLLQTVIMQTVSDELSKVELSNTELG